MRLDRKARTAGGRARLGKLYGIAMAFLLAPAFLWGQSGLLAMDLALIASDGFEDSSFSGGNGWLAPWDISGAADVISSDEPFTGASHLRLRGGATAGRAVDLSGWADVELGFWARADSFESGDSVRLEVSSDGNSWIVLETWQDEDDDNQYHLYEFSLANETTSSAFFLRFVSQMNEPSDYFFVDEVMLWGEPALTHVSPTPETAPVTSPLSSPVSTEDLAIDGAFSDWEGYPNLPDAFGDANKARSDLAAFYWANNDGSEANYWMIERHPADDDGDEENERRPKDDEDKHDNANSKKVKYIIHIDTDNDGNFTEKEDRRVLVDYRPRVNDSEVRVRVKQGRGGMTISSARGDWGESENEGGRRVEFQVNWNDLGITSGDVIRMYVESDRNDRLPDSGDIQWAPASVLGYGALGAVLIGSALTFWHIRRKRERICPSGER